MYDLKILRGNAFTVVIAVKAYRADGSEVEDFDLGSCSGVSVKMGVNALKSVDYVVSDNNITIAFSGNEGLGWYQLEVTGTLDGEKWRFDNERMLQIVEHSSGVNIPDDSILAEDSYTIQGNVQLLQAASSGEGVQSDWEETNSASLAYIKNKPDLSSFATQAWVTAKGYATQVWVAAQNFVTQAWVAAQGFYVKAASGIPKSDLASDVQASLGKADSALQSFTETDPTVPSWAKAANKPSYTASEVGALPDSTVIPAAQVNSDWDAVSGVAQILNKPTIPSALSELSEDASHRTVSDTEKASWNGKQNALTFDNTPTDNSNNPVKSGGVYNATVTKQEKMIMMSSSVGTTLQAAPNYYHLLTGEVNTLTVTLPTISSVLYVQDIVIGFTTGANPAITFTSSHNIYYADGYSIEANTRYEVNALFNGIDWVVMATKITTS